MPRIKSTLLWLFVIGGFISLMSCGSGDDSTEATQESDVPVSIEDQGKSRGNVENAEDKYGQKYIIIETEGSDQNVSTDEMCQVIKELKLPEEIATLLENADEIRQTDYCLVSRTGPEVAQLPMPDIINKTFETIRENHPDLLVYGVVELTEKIAPAHGYEFEFIKVPSMLIEVGLSPTSISPMVYVKVSKFYGSYGGKVWNYDYVINTVQPIADQIANEFDLKPMARMYDRGKVTHVFSIPSDRDSKQLTEEVYQYLKDNGWNIKEYASFMGVTALNAEKDNVEFQLSNIAGWGQNASLFAFSLSLKN